MFTGSRKTIVAGVLTGFASLVGAGATSASGHAVCQTDDCAPSPPLATAPHQVAPADTGLDLEWGTGAAPHYVPARWTGPTFAQLRGSGPLYELRWGNGAPVLVRIDAG
jgi:hypothetical protein